MEQPGSGAGRRLTLLKIDQHPAIHQQSGAINIARHIGGQENCRARQIFRRAQTAQRHAPRHGGAFLGIGQILLVEIGFDGGRQHRIATNAVFSQGDGQ